MFLKYDLNVHISRFGLSMKYGENLFQNYMKNISCHGMPKLYELMPREEMVEIK
jgi:hypothetical protein